MSQLFEMPTTERATRLQLPAVIESKASEGPEKDFDWTKDMSVILPRQPAVAVYFDDRDRLVIRQQNWPDDDSFVTISPNLILNFLDKLTDACGIPTCGAN